MSILTTAIQYRTEIDLQRYSQLTFDKGEKAIQRRIFSTNGAGAIIYPQTKNMNYNLYRTPDTKINSMCIIDLNIKYTSVKLLEYNIGENFRIQAS